MAKQLNVNLAFTADTGKAKAQLKDLQSQLNNLINASGPNGMATQITEATKAAAELKVHLQNATNVKTGNLDFSKLNESIKQSGKSLVQYGEQLNSMGPQGQKAFMALAQSVANAEVPIRRANTALTEMWTTMKNTARWQLSSSILHGFMGAVQSAYGYAQDLNESLNNIRIVTGQNVDQMAAFAENANKAAKALSTTTTAYTNAALIYYQQGDSDSTVLEKTDVTTKMANVTGQSAEVVSDQLTAIWNNFNKSGEESYEKYADILTALGAATASSTDEIAGGLEKFASIADMIGLSYEYAASALATITATTRQSEDVVGTALKTIFARIQGLSLGETLDDGTNLNKYSEALQKVGISIYDQAGELKEMDAILDEMGAKWGTLSKDQQVALAQTVAGVRQYNQLVSLMDNWDYFGENLAIAQNAEGELDKQADIYAESWQAASNRVRAALEGIYSTLIDDEAFISVLNTIEKIVTYFDNLIDTVGGLSGVLTTLGAILTKVFSNQLAQSISNMAYSIKMMSPKEQAKAQTEKSNTIKEFAGIMASAEGTADSTAGKTASAVYTDKLNLQEKMISNAHRMSEAEKQNIQILMDQLSVQEKQTIEAAKQVDITKNQKSDAASKIYANAAQKDSSEGQTFDVSKAAKSMENVATSSKALNQVSNILRNLSSDGEQFEKQLYEITQNMQNMANQDIGIDFKDDLVTLSQLLDTLRNSDAESEDWAMTLQQIQGLFAGINQEAIDNTAAETGSEINEVREYSNAVIAADNAVDNLKQSQDDLAASNVKVGESIDNAQGKVKTWADSLVSFANGALSIVSALQMVGGIVDTLENPDMSTWEKVLSIGSSVLMMVTMLVPTFTALIGAIGGTGAAAAGATGPVAGFGVALNAALGPIGWVALALTALVAIFAVVATSIDTASEKAQKKFNQMSEDAKQAADALNEAENAYEDLQDTISSYSSARDNIDSLTQGTKEFEAAVIEANDAARKLMETYGVAGKFNANTGLIEIDKDALEKAQEDQAEKLEEARVNNTAAQSNKLMAENDLSNAKIVEQNDMGYWERVGQTLNASVATGFTMGAGLATAGVVTSVIAPVSAAVGALSGALASLTEAGVSMLMQNRTNEDQIAALESLQDAYIQSGGNFETAMASLGEEEQELINSLGMTDSELQNLCAQVSANTAAILQNNKQLIDANFQDNKDYQNSNHKDELNTLLANDLKTETDRIYEEKWKDGADGGKTDKEAQQAYAEMMGYTWVKNKGNNLGVYSKGDGSADFTISDETARRALAQKEAMEALGQSVEKYNATLEAVNKTGENFGEGVGDLMLRMAGGQGASFADASGSEIADLQNAINNAKSATDIISDEDAKNMGYDDAAAYVESLQLGIDSYNDQLSKVGENLSSAISKDFLTNTEGLTLQGAQSMGDNLTNAFKTSGTEAANALDDVFVAAGEDAEELSTLLESVDWGDPNAVAKLNAAIQEQGLNVNTSSAEWLAYTSAMSQAGQTMIGVQSQFDSLRQTMADTASIMKNLETNSIISDEDYEKLIAINPAIKDMFMITAEGYRFLGSKGDLEDLLVGNAKESIAGVKEEFEALSNEGAALANKQEWFDQDGGKVLSGDRNVASMANQISGDAAFDNSLAYMGVSKESLQEASNYILQYTDQDGNVLKDAEGFDQTKYDEYVQATQDVYTQLGNIRQQYLDGDFSSENAEQLIASTATNITELQQMQAEGAIGTEAFNQQLQVLTTAGMSAAGSLSELHSILGQGLAAGATIDYSNFADALLRLGENFSNAESESWKFQQALASGNEETITAAQAELEAAIAAGEMAEQYDLSAEHIERYADELASSGKYQKANEKSLTQMAKDQLRFDRAVINASDNMDTWSKDLKVAAKTGHLVSETADQMAEAYGDLLDIDGSELSSDFLNNAENLELMKAALDGNEEAYNALQEAAGKDILANIGIDTSQWDADMAAIEAKVLEVEGMGLADIEAGASLDDANFLAALTEMVNAAGMTAQQATDYLSTMGVDAEVVTKPETITETVGYNLIPTIKTVEGPYGLGTMSFSGVTYDQEPVTQTKEVTGTALEVTSASKSSGGAIKSSGSAPKQGGSNGGKKNGGKKSSPAEKVKFTKQSDVVERYKEQNDVLDDIENTLNDINREKDRAYGANRVKMLDKEQKALLAQKKALEAKAEVAADLYELDKKALKEKGTEYGLNFEFDDLGNIKNYTTEMNKLFTELHNAEEKMDKMSTKEAQDEFKKATVQPIQDKIDEIKDLIGQYDETKELMEDLEDEAIEAFNKWQDSNYEELQLKLELKLEINDDELRMLEFKLKRMEDNFYKMAESAAILGNNQVNNYKNQLQVYEGHKASLDAAYAAGEISEDAYMEGIKEVRDGIYEQLEALLDLDDQMMHYYRDTLEAASEEIADFTDHMEHLTGVFDHYLSLMEILGKQKDYSAMGNFLGGKADTIKDRLDVAKEYYDMLKENSKADEYWTNYQNALAANDTDMAAWWKEQWDAETEALDEAQENMLSLTEEWAEAMKAVIENNMSQISDTLEKALTDGLGFDKLMDDFDKLNTRQEEYLTKTNQLYETNKLMRTANKALDETDNQAAKLKLKNFIDETKSLQENTQLSKYELEIQQAKYDLLLAEIALEEAQNAKATVRLSRDNEGNFGYVYTADQDAISDAQQQLDDAENNLYNKSLEGQQNYTEKYLQAQQEMFDELDELWSLYYEEGAITKEEYEQRYADLQNHYYGDGGVLSTYAHLYNIGVQTDANATADNWQKNYGAMTQNTADWQSAVDTYYVAVQGQITSWEAVATSANSTVSGALNNSATATKNLTDESEVLRDKIVNGIIPAIDDELVAVQSQTDAYADQRDTLLELIDAYEEYIKQINSQVAIANTDFDKNTDYSALMNEYLNSGGKVGDATYNELLRQREAKIDWLESQGYDESYWGTRGDATTALYNDLVAGKGDQEWFKADYMSDEKLKEAFAALEVPLGALEENLNKVAENVDKVAVATDEVAKSNTSVGEAVTSVGEAVTTSTTEAKDALTVNLDTVNNTMQKSTEDTVVTLETMTEDITNAIENMTNEITSTLDTLSSDISNSLDRVSHEISDVASAIGSINFGVSGLAGFASGGYTGDWGPQGKLAMLHEKELVLNAADTENLLSTIDLVREISNMIDIQASGASLFNLMANSGLTTANEVLEQNVTIHAEFPNATNHSEIEEAFNNLVNKASQYANRKS